MWRSQPNKDTEGIYLTKEFSKEGGVGGIGLVACLICNADDNHSFSVPLNAFLLSRLVNFSGNKKLKAAVHPRVQHKHS